MSEGRISPRLWTIPPGVPFLPALADALLEGRLVPGFAPGDDPLALSDATIFLPTRRAVRELRAVFLQRLGGKAVILPTIRALGEFDEDEALFDISGAEAPVLEPAIEPLERLLLLAPLVQAWKQRLPAHLAAMYDEAITVPANLSDAIWLARDLGELIDEIETEGADWTRLSDLVPAELANWWQVTLEFLQIVTQAWPAALAERGRVNPAAFRNARLQAEADRLARSASSGPVIAAGSTGSIPATANLLATIARLPQGAVVLPGLVTGIDRESWEAIDLSDADPATFGHPFAGLRRLLSRIGVTLDEVESLSAPSPSLAARGELVLDALRPTATTHVWADLRPAVGAAVATGALDHVTLLEARDEREEALAIAAKLRLAIEEGKDAALVTGDRGLARRVSSELRRFGIEADDSAGRLLIDTPPATLLRLAVEVALRPGDPVPILDLLKHPLLKLKSPRSDIREAAEVLELAALRGGTGTPDACTLESHLALRLEALEQMSRKPFWLSRIKGAPEASARDLAGKLEAALRPLFVLRNEKNVPLSALVSASVEAIEALAQAEDGALGDLYGHEDGEALAGFLRGLLSAAVELDLRPQEWPETLSALVAGSMVKPSPRGDGRVSIWGTLEARLLSVDTLVIGGLNEGVWPRRPDSGRFMSRGMKAGLSIEPPERRIGQAAHDFLMAMGAGEVVLTRAQRSGDAPGVESRWLQRLRTLIGKEALAPVAARGTQLLGWARALDHGPRVSFVPRPEPAPPVNLRPRHFSITDIETLRRDPYAIFARHVLGLARLDPVIGSPGAAERGTLFHDILHHFLVENIDPNAPDAVDRLVALGRAEFDRVALPADIEAVWWPRFRRMATQFVHWERERDPDVVRRIAEIGAKKTPVGGSGATLRGRADRIDRMRGGTAQIIDFKTGSSPSPKQARTLLSPQLALEAALLQRGAFDQLEDAPEASDLLYVRLRPDGSVKPETILKNGKDPVTAPDLAGEAWARTEKLLAFYLAAHNGYKSRVIPFREGEAGEYDHLARVLEWSAGVEGDEGGEE